MGGMGDQTRSREPAHGLLAGDEANAKELRDRLAHVGIDNVVGYSVSLEGFENVPVPSIAPAKLED